MSDEDRDIPGLAPAERALASRLRELGPLMREQEAAEAELDRDFAANLRSHLVHGEELMPHPSFARDLRKRLTGEPQRRAAVPVPRRARIAWILGALAGLAALVTALLASSLFSPKVQAPAFGAPYPTEQELLFSFPAPSSRVSRVTPTQSLIHPGPGVPFAGHLEFQAGSLPRVAPTLRAYRLAPTLRVVARGRLILGIRSREHPVRTDGAPWEVAADGGSGSGLPLHSLAESPGTGEVVYHDRRNFDLKRARRTLGRRIAVAVAGRWLVRLGWPAGSLSLIDAKTVPGLRRVREVRFGWTGVPGSVTAAATLWVTPNRSVIEAWIWPPVAQQGSIRPRSFSEAWSDVHAHRLPVAVEGLWARPRSRGVAVLQNISVVRILAWARAGAYLVPVYRFQGIVHIRGIGQSFTWYSLAPGARR